jgi:aminomethyltransferase
MPNQTPLLHLHRQVGARITEFAGWEMPLSYSGILAEAKAVRSSAGLFDISHMGRLDVSGPDAAKLLAISTVNDVDALQVGRGHYSLVLNEAGGVVDDVILLRIDSDRYLLVTNAINLGAVHARLAQTPVASAQVHDQTLGQAMLALQGPAAADVLGAVAGTQITALPYFGAARIEVAGVDCLVSRTGYTGEDGFELVCSAAHAEQLWKALLSFPSVVPCGLGARDVLRLEAGYPLYGHEINESTNPFEARLGWVVRSKSQFVGRQALESAGLLAANGAPQKQPERRLVGLRPSTRSVPRQGDLIEYQGELVGQITSGTFSPNLNASLAMGYVPTPLSSPGTVFTIRSGAKTQDAVASTLPFGSFGRARKRTE